MKKVLLMKPLDSKYHIIAPSLGLGYLATIARKYGCITDILDPNKEKTTTKAFIKRITGKRYDLILIQMYTFEYEKVKKLTKFIRKISPYSCIIVGGPHPSGIPKQTLKSLPYVDFILYGEAEIGLNKLFNLNKNGLLSFNSLKKIPNLVWRKKNVIICNQKQFIRDINKIGFPAWDLVEPNKYQNNIHGIFSKSKSIAPMLISRGCIYDCIFCVSKLIHGKNFRSRHPKNFIEELKLLYYKYNIREVQIEDDNFIVKRSIAKDICKKILNSNLKIKWSCPNGVRVENLDSSLIKLMEKSGCYSFNVGIESGNQRTLFFIKKNLNLNMLEKKLKLIKMHSKIKIIGSFLIGLPEETIDDIKKTISLSKKLPLDRALFYCVLPYPGTEIWYKYFIKKMINWSDFKFYNFFSINKNISNKQIRQLIRKAFLSFYLRPKIMFSILLEINSFTQIKSIFLRLKKILIVK